MQYKLVNQPIGNPYLHRTDDAGTVSIVPMNEANIDYQEYLRWCEQGNQPLPPDEEQT